MAFYKSVHGTEITYVQNFLGKQMKNKREPMKMIAGVFLKTVYLNLVFLCSIAHLETWVKQCDLFHIQRECKTHYLTQV